MLAPDDPRADGSTIRALRDALGLSRRALGEAVGVGPRTVEAWEQGLRTPSRAARMLLARLAAAPRK